MTNEEMFMEAMHARHACKLFDEKRKIPQASMETILQIGRLSPSSFGMEPWRFLVIRDRSLKERLRPLCWNQPQITTCSDLLVIKTIISPLAPGSRYSREMLDRKGLPEEKMRAYYDKYDKFVTEKMVREGLFAWGAKQCYIAAANMMTGAAAMGIDSCAIEGLEKEKVEAVLDMDVAKEELALMIAFGYRVNEPSGKFRLPLEKIVEYI